MIHVTKFQVIRFTELLELQGFIWALRNISNSLKLKHNTTTHKSDINTKRILVFKKHPNYVLDKKSQFHSPVYADISMDKQEDIEVTEEEVTYKHGQQSSHLHHNK